MPTQILCSEGVRVNNSPDTNPDVCDASDAENPENNHNPTTNAPTPRQLRGLRALVACVDRDGFPPTVRELAKADGCGVTPAFMLLMHLERRGLVRRLPGAHRGIAVTDAGRAALAESEAAS